MYANANVAKLIIRILRIAYQNNRWSIFLRGPGSLRSQQLLQIIQRYQHILLLLIYIYIYKINKIFNLEIPLVNYLQSNGLKIINSVTLCEWFCRDNTFTVFVCRALMAKWLATLATKIKRPFLMLNSFQTRDLKLHETKMRHDRQTVKKQINVEYKFTYSLSPFSLLPCELHAHAYIYFRVVFWVHI